MSGEEKFENDLKDLIPGDGPTFDEMIKHNESKSALLLSTGTHYNPESDRWPAIFRLMEVLQIVDDEGVIISDRRYLRMGDIQEERVKWRHFLNDDDEANTIKTLHMTSEVYSVVRSYHQGFDNRTKVLLTLTRPANLPCNSVLLSVTWLSRYLSNKAMAMRILAYLMSRSRSLVIKLAILATTSVTVPRVVFYQSYEVSMYILRNPDLRALLLTVFVGLYGLDYGLLHSVGVVMAETRLFVAKGALEHLNAVYGGYSVMSIRPKDLGAGSELSMIYEIGSTVCNVRSDFFNVLVSFARSRFLEMHIGNDEVEALYVEYMHLATAYVGDSYLVSPCLISPGGQPSDAVIALVRNRRLIVDNVTRAILRVEPILSHICEEEANEIEDLVDFRSGFARMVVRDD